MPVAPLQTVAVASTSYTTLPSVAFAFEPDSILCVNRSAAAADIVYISFDGITDHALLVPGTVPSLEFQAKRPNVWLRRDAGAANPTSVSVMANTVR